MAVFQNRELKDECGNILLHVVEEGSPMEEFNPDNVIDMWFLSKIFQLTAGPHQLERKWEEGDSISYVDPDSIVMQGDEEENEEDFKSFLW